jgi:hypothetical protein
LFIVANIFVHLRKKTYNHSLGGKMTQRKTRVIKEGWPLVDGWYWCPKSLIEKRHEFEYAQDKVYWKALGSSTQIPWWAEAEYEVNQRVAHACKDGVIRAGWGVASYKKKGGTISLYGKCKHCNVKLSDGLKTIIQMELIS